MGIEKHRLTVVLMAVLVVLPGAASGKKRSKGRTGSVESTGSALLWRDPGNIGTRNLFYGPGGKEHEPHGPFTFEKEDLDGSNPKFVVRDSDGIKWKVKMGAEARPETVATRLVWSVGYFTNEDYFVPELHVQDMPRLKRGQNQVLPGGVVKNVRLKRHEKGEDKVETWKWREDPFEGTREFNGLRIMMALINNWDLKDVNNSVYQEKDGKAIYMVSDLGASFGTAYPTWPHDKAKGNLKAYQHSKFIDRAGSEFIDFHDPGNPSFKYWILPKECLSRRGLHWIGRKIPRTDAQWMGQLLAQLSPNQIEDAFRAAGYTVQDVDGFARVVEQRIAELKAL